MGNKRHGRQTTYEKKYIYGNTVRKVELVPLTEFEQPVRKLSNTARKNREKAAYMSLGYVAFLMLAIVIMGYACIQYLELQSDITRRQKNIVTMEGTLNDLKLANNEELSRIEGSVDIEEIKRIAMDELGMKYPDQSQMIAFNNEGSDYVRQFQDVPDR